MSDKLILIKEAAKMLGVTPLTLRNWDKSGKLPAYRHPMNNYRGYKLEDVERVAKLIRENTDPVFTRRKSSRKKLQVKHLD